MKPAPFLYRRATSLADAARVLADTPDAMVLAGGQSLMPELAAREHTPGTIVDITRVVDEDASAISLRGGALQIGARITQSEALASPLLREHSPLLVDAIASVGHPHTRNRGTVCGSVAQNDSLAQIPLAMEVAGADVLLIGPRGEREVGVASAADRAHDELVAAVRVPIRQHDVSHGFVELRHGSAIAAVAVLCSPAVAARDANGQRTPALSHHRIGVAGVGGRRLVTEVEPGDRHGAVARARAALEGARFDALPDAPEDFRRAATLELTTRATHQALDRLADAEGSG